jgi:hypothetical protein
MDPDPLASTQPITPGRLGERDPVFGAYGSTELRLASDLISIFEKGAPTIKKVQQL